MTERYYSSSAGKMILQLGITAIATTLLVDTTAGLPGSTPFTLLVDVGQASEEVVTVTQVSGNTLVVIRGEDGTSAQPHANGAVVRHGITARDLRDSRSHENSTAGVHGVTSNVAGIADAQTLTNKNLTSGTNSFPSTLATLTGSQTLTNKRFTPASTAGNAEVVQGLAGQLGALSVWKDAANTTLAYVGPDGTIANSAANVGCIFLGSESTPTTYQAQISGKDASKFVLNLNGPTGQSADLLRLGVNGTRVAGVRADGTIDATAGAFSGGISAASATVSGPVSGTTGTFSGAVSGSNLPASSASKAGKRVHWGSVSRTADGSGYATVTHGAGFTPATVVANSMDGYQMGTDQITSTSFRVRILQADGTVFAGATTTVAFFCGE